MSRYDIVCIHTIVGYAPADAAHFSTTGDGRLIQSRDTAYQSAANLHGNPRIIAIENEDHGPLFGGTPRLPGWVPLTDKQVLRCAEVLAWANKEHGIPLQLCPNSRPGSRGLAHHRQGIDGNFGGYRFPGRVDGGEVWSSSYGKVCPTDVRIAQLPDILARAKMIVGGDEMTPEQERKLDQALDGLAEVKEMLSNARQRDVATRERDRRIAARVMATIKDRSLTGAEVKQAVEAAMNEEPA